MSVTTDHRGGSAEAAVGSVMAWRHFLNEFVMDPAELDDDYDWGDLPAELATTNKRVAATGLEIGFFAMGTPLVPDARLVVAWRVMREAWCQVLDAMPHGCRLTSVLERFLLEHGHEPAYRHHRVAALGLSLGVPRNNTVLEVIRAAHASAQQQALLAAHTGRC